MAELPKGMRAYITPSGLTCLWVHYSADPEKDPDTPEGQKWLQKRLQGYIGGTESSKWQRENEINFDILGGEPVFPFAFNPKCPIYIAQKDPAIAIKEMTLYGCFDYGSTNPSDFHVWGIDRSSDAYALWELYEPCNNYIDMCEKIKAGPYFKHLQYIVADPQIFAKDQQRKKGKVSIASLFAEEGVHFIPGNHGSDYDIAQYFLGRYWANAEKWGESGYRPHAWITSACPKLKWEISNLRLEEHRTQTSLERTNNPEKIVQKHNHAWDATALLFDKLMHGPARKKRVIKRNTLEWVDREFDRMNRKGDKNYVRAG